jgi:phospholipase A-2-activating protein
VKFWAINRINDEINISEPLAPLYHSHWITAVTSLSRGQSPSFPEGVIVTGCMDNVIRLFNFEGNQIGQLIGHEKPAVSFGWTEDYSLISGSWDGTARLWDLINSCNTATYRGHENGVHVLPIGNGLLVTVSTGEQVDNKPANFRTRIWSMVSGKQVCDPIQDHGGSIRSIFPIPGIGFGTTSNDGTVLYRAVPDGHPVAMVEHRPKDGSDGYPPFILDGTALILPNNEIAVASCGEDGSVMIWREATFSQSIPHPACVWSISSLDTGGQSSELVTACHDGYIRIFSLDDTLATSPAAISLQQQFDAEVVASQSTGRGGPSQEEINKSPWWDDRGKYGGKSDGQVGLLMP